MDIVKLKTFKNNEEEITVYAVRLNLNFNGDLPLNNKLEIIKSKIWDILFLQNIEYEPDALAIIYYGILSEFKNKKDVVAKFKKKAMGGANIYRNYCISEEEQRKRSSYCNVAEDYTTSFNTVMSALNSKIGAIITIKKINNDTRSSNVI